MRIELARRSIGADAVRADDDASIDDRSMSATDADGRSIPGLTPTTECSAVAANLAMVGAVAVVASAVTVGTQQGPADHY